MNTVYRALSDPTRRQILKLLREKDLTAGEIAEHFTMTKPSLSKHFNILRSAGLIQGEKSGVTITYHLNVSVLEEAIMALMEIFKLKGYARVDFRADLEGNLWVLEINCNPSFYGFYNIAKNKGLNFKEILRRIVEAV